MVKLADLAPGRKDRVMDLVAEAGIDVSDWANSSRGAQGASTNPKYCYEWAFAQPHQVVILNLWHAEMDQVGDAIVRRGNFRQDAARDRSLGGRTAWVRRALRLDEAISLAKAQNLPVRVIVNAGVRRDHDAARLGAARVALRQLDPEPWRVSDYDIASGAHVLTRGAPAPRFVDQFTLRADAPDPMRTREVSGVAYVRNVAVRNAALRRAGGRCEHCHVTGFRMADGSIYLETHHVTPLGEGGPDTADNLVALCPNHHRQAHYGADRDTLRAAFQALLAAHA